MARGTPPRHALRSRLARSLPAAVLLLPACSGVGGGGSPEALLFGLPGTMQQGYGESTRQGAELALREINAAGGIGGRPLALRVKDDQASSERAPGVAQELADDPQVLAVVGHVNSGTTLEAGPIYDRSGLPAVATTATSPLVSQLGDWVYRIASSDSANAAALAQHARAMAPRVAILYMNDDYGRGLAGSFRDAYVSGGGVVVQEDPYLEDVADLTPYLQRLRRRGVEMVFIAGLDAGAARIIQQARTVGLEARFVGGDGLEPLAAAGGTYNGTVVGTLYHPQASPAAGKFAEAFRREYGREPDGFAAAAYDAVRLLAQAAAEKGADRRSIREYLAGVGREGGAAAFEGATGTIRFDENGDPMDKSFTVGVIRNGTIELLRSAR